MWPVTVEVISREGSPFSSVALLTKVWPVEPGLETRTVLPYRKKKLAMNRARIEAN
jgi:hypothetical protein